MARYCPSLSAFLIDTLNVSYFNSSPRSDFTTVRQCGNANSCGNPSKPKSEKPQSDNQEAQKKVPLFTEEIYKP
jgi:hypothetical protein